MSHLKYRKNKIADILKVKNKMSQLKNMEIKIIDLKK